MKHSTRSTTSLSTKTLSPPDISKQAKITTKPTTLNPKDQKKTSQAAGGSGTARTEPNGRKSKNATKNEELPEKTTVTLKSIEKHFDLSNEESEDYDSDTDNPENTSKTENVEEERLKKELINHNETNKRRSVEIERAMLAISYIKSITGKATKVTAPTRTAVEKAYK